VKLLVFGPLCNLPLLHRTDPREQIHVLTWRKSHIIGVVRKSDCHDRKTTKGILGINEARQKAACHDPQEGP
jgi:hypothetical protein